MVPAPYWPLGIGPWTTRNSSGWSSVRTALRLRLGSSGMPLGIAHEASVPSCSRRRSQCRRVAWGSCTTKRPAAAGSPSAAPPAGSGVSVKARFARYSARRSLAIRSAVAVLFLVGLAVGLGGGLLLGEIRLADTHLDLRLGGAVLGVLAQLLL